MVVLNLEKQGAAGTPGEKGAAGTNGINGGKGPYVASFVGGLAQGTHYFSNTAPQTESKNIGLALTTVFLEAGRKYTFNVLALTGSTAPAKVFKLNIALITGVAVNAVELAASIEIVESMMGNVAPSQMEIFTVEKEIANTGFYLLSMVNAELAAAGSEGTVFVSIK